MWVPGVRLRLWSLVASCLNRWAICPAPQNVLLIMSTPCLKPFQSWNLAFVFCFCFGLRQGWPGTGSVPEDGLELLILCLHLPSAECSICSSTRLFVGYVFGWFWETGSYSIPQAVLKHTLQTALSSHCDSPSAFTSWVLGSHTWAPAMRPSFHQLSYVLITIRGAGRGAHICNPSAKGDRGKRISVSWRLANSGQPGQRNPVLKNQTKQTNKQTKD